jgi:hypothetical protein
VIRLLRRPGPRGAALALCALGLLALTGCGPGPQSRGLDVDPSAGSATASPPSAPPADPETCFDVASAYTALGLVPLSTDETDPDFRPRETVASVRELASRMPAELRPAFDDAVEALRSAGGSVQPAELAALHGALAPVGDWLQRHCAEPTPAG